MRNCRADIALVLSMSGAGVKQDAQMVRSPLTMILTARSVVRDPVYLPKRTACEQRRCHELLLSACSHAYSQYSALHEHLPHAHANGNAGHPP